MSSRCGKKSSFGNWLRRIFKVSVWSLALVLAAQVAYWVLLVTDAKVLLPDFADRALADALAEIGIGAEFSEIAVRASGRVEINDLRLLPAGHSDAPISADRVVADFYLPGLVFGKLAPRRIFVDGGNVFCPASTSPSGVIVPAVTEIRTAISRKKKWIEIETLQAKLGEMPITIHGQFVLPEMRTGVAGETFFGIRELVRDVWKALAQGASEVIRAHDVLRGVGAASLSVEVAGDLSGAVSLDVLSRGEKFVLPGAVVARDATLAFSVLFDGTNFKPGRDSRLTVESAEWHDAESGLTVKTGNLRFASRFGENWETPTGGYFSACDIDVNGERVDYARGFANWAKFPMLSAGAYLVKGGDFVKADAVGNWETRALSTHFQVDVAPGKYLADEKIKRFLPAELERLSFPSRAKIAGDAEIAPGLKFAEADFSLRTGRLKLMDFDLRSIEAKVRLTPEKIEVTDADVRAVDYRAQGDFSTGFTADSEYRFLLRGNTFPHFLDEIFGTWWPEIWKDYRLDPKKLPYVDIEVCGQWEGRPDEFIFCGAAGGNINVQGQIIDFAELRIVELPDLLALFDMRATQRELSATGTLQIHYNLVPKYTRHSLRFQFDGTLPKDTALALAGFGLPEILAPVTLEKPATAGVTGYLNFANSEDPGRDRVRVRVDAPGNLSAWGFPFSDFKGTVAYDSDVLAIIVDEAGFAGGKLATTLDAETLDAEDNKTNRFRHGKMSNRAWIELLPKSPVLTLELDIINARRVPFFAALEGAGLKPKVSEETQPSGNNVPAKDKKKEDSDTPAADNSSLDIQFFGTLELPEIASLRGEGVAALYDPDLPQLHVFGGVSRLLDNIGLGVSSFKLDRAEGKFFARKGKLYFPHLVIGGKDSKINASGNYTIETGALEARAVFTVEVGEKIPVIGSILSRINRIPRLMPANVTGTLEHPKWSLDPTPSALLRSSFNEELGTPPADDK